MLDSKDFFSDKCIWNVFATTRLWLFSTNIDENEVCFKKSLKNNVRKVTHIILGI